MIRIEVHGLLQMRALASSNLFGCDTQRLAPLVGLDAGCVARWFLLWRQSSACLREPTANYFGSLTNGKAVCRSIG